MIRRTTCPKCKSISEYDNKSVWEGNREVEEIICPVCGEIIDRVFTDLSPTAVLVEDEDSNNS